MSIKESVKGNISEFRLGLNGDCVYDALLHLTSNSERDKEGNDDVFSSLFCLGLCFLSQSGHCLFLFVQKLFSVEGLTQSKPTDPSSLKPSIWDQLAKNASNLKNCLSRFINYPPNYALLTDCSSKRPH